MMSATARRYDHARDYERVGEFLVRTYRTGGGHVNWLQPRWEYMHFHPHIRRVSLEAIGVWEADGEVVGVVHPEHSAGTAYCEVDPAHESLVPEMLEYAGANLSVPTEGGSRLRAYVNDADAGFRSLVRDLGYAESGDREPMSRFDIPDPFQEIPLPAGFRLRSLAEENDLEKLDRVLWRGFNHPGEPPEDGIEGRKFMQSAPNYRKDLNIVVEAPTGEFVSYYGMWYEPVHKIAYVEPVATDPEYRRKGLGRAAVLEGIRRCGVLGAGCACVGSSQPFYLSMGFRQVYTISTWQREWGNWSP